MWRKMQRKGLTTVDELGDVLALRFILAPVLQSGLSQGQYRAHQARPAPAARPPARCGPRPPPVPAA